MRQGTPQVLVFASIALAVCCCSTVGPRPIPEPSAKPPDPPNTAPPPSTERQAVPVPVPSQEPLAADEPFAELPLEGAKPAVVSLPLGSTTARPVLVATHGAGGRASIHCAMWRRIVEDRAFILCPRGTAMWPYDPPHEAGYYYDGHPALAIEITKALAALVQAFPDRVDTDRPVFAGYSQGANMGSLILPTHDAKFGKAILWEGGVGENQEWNIRTSERFREHGGSRVILACGRPDCYEAAQLTASYMRRGGLLPRIVYVSGAGHTYAGKLGERVKESFAWLIQDDPRW